MKDFKPYPARPNLREIIPPGKRPTASVSHFTLEHADVFLNNLRYLRDGAPFMVARPGEYIKLVADKQLQMSDTDMEWTTNQPFLEAAHGDVLVAGLGIGLAIVPLLNKPGVNSVTVIEVNADVIGLVAPHIAHERLRVLQGDANEPDAVLNGDEFDSIWLDVWQTFSSDNLNHMASLRSDYKKRLRRGGFIGCWSEKETKMLARRGIV